MYTSKRPPKYSNLEEISVTKGSVVQVGEWFLHVAVQKPRFPPSYCSAITHQRHRPGLHWTRLGHRHVHVPAQGKRRGSAAAGHQFVKLKMTSEVACDSSTPTPWA